MTPEGWLILCAVSAVGGYTLWVAERATRLRIVLTAFAIVSLAVAVLLHDLETARIVASTPVPGSTDGRDGPP